MRKVIRYICDHFFQSGHMAFCIAEGYINSYWFSCCSLFCRKGYIHKFRSLLECILFFNSVRETNRLGSVLIVCYCRL